VKTIRGGTGAPVFSAIVIEKSEAGQAVALTDLDEAELPDVDVNR